MALEHLTLARRQRAALAQDLLGNRELAEIVELAGEADQLDLLARQVEPLGDRGGVMAGMSAR
jgi:hypothetical protein